MEEKEEASRQLKDKVLEMLCKKHGYASIKWSNKLSSNFELDSGVLRVCFSSHGFPPALSVAHHYITRATSTEHPLDAIVNAAKDGDVVHMLESSRVLLKRGTTLEQLAIELDLDGKQDE